MKEVSSLSALSLSSWIPSSDTMQLPELRHNLRLVADGAKGDVEGLAREGRRVNERRRLSIREEQIARKKVEDATASELYIDKADLEIARLERIQDIVAFISQRATEEATKPAPSFSSLASGFDTLLDEYKAEYAALALDEVVVGAIGQVVSIKTEGANGRLAKPLQSGTRSHRPSCLMSLCDTNAPTIYLPLMLSRYMARMPKQSKRRIGA